MEHIAIAIMAYIVWITAGLYLAFAALNFFMWLFGIPIPKQRDVPPASDEVC